MFDDIPNKNSNVPPNLPTEPVDMFAGVENNDEPAPGTKGPSALDAGILKKKTVGVQVPPADLSQGAVEVNYPIKAPVIGKVIGFIIFIVVAAGVGYGGWKLYSYFSQKDTGTPEAQPNLEQQTPITDETTEEPAETGETEMPEVSTSSESAVTTTVTGQVEFGEVIDTDKDGLDDIKEEEAKTNMAKADTDDDSLIDGDEVIIWRTNPLNPDTDGDSYLDGDEVKHGYNPLGPGKLFSQPNGSTSTVTPPPASTSSQPATPTINEVDL